MRKRNSDFKTDMNVTTNNDSGNNTTAVDFLSETMSYNTYKIGEAINQFYFPVLVPVGVTGNLLAFLVVQQASNRHLSISQYISSLAITDTIALVIGLVSYLNSVLEVDIPPSQHWFCAIATAVLWTACLCSTLFILSMTFDRFYSIIRPHKAASFNTVKRAKITIAFIIVISVVFNIPYLYVISNLGRTCLPVQSHQWQEIYFWLTYVMQFVFPFVSLLSMNSVIIHTLRNRTMVIMQPENRKGQCQGQGQLKKVKGIEKQTYAILLLVSFSFFVLITPLYVSLLYTRLVDYMKTPRSFARFNLFYHVMHKMFYTNNGINFFLYVISGRKFRNDLKQLFVCNRDKGTYTYSGSSDTNTKISTVEGDRF